MALRPTPPSDGAAVVPRRGHADAARGWTPTPGWRPAPADSRWHPDVLGEGFERRTLPLGVDAEGDVVATLVRHRPPARWTWRPRGTDLRGWDVLYVHGWNDYFFQRHVAAWFTARGARFYALDLRKYGRSLRPGQTPGLIADLTDYDADIAAALEAIAADDHRSAGELPVEASRALTGLLGRAPEQRRLMLLGHSTGGLTLSLWADRHPGRAQALLLNSPWLELQTRSLGRQMLAPVIGLQARVDPRLVLPSIDQGFYTRAVSADEQGQWHYDRSWRAAEGFAMPAVWLQAVLAGHARVARGLDVRVPVLTLLSVTSTLQLTWSDAMLRSDSVLDVDDVARRALQLGPVVTVARIEDALHDVFLSRPTPRRAAFAAIDRWAGGYLR